MFKTLSVTNVGSLEDYSVRKKYYSSICEKELFLKGIELFVCQDISFNERYDAYRYNHAKESFIVTSAGSTFLQELVTRMRVYGNEDDYSFAEFAVLGDISTNENDRIYDFGSNIDND